MTTPSLWEVGIWVVSTLGIGGTLVLLILYPGIVAPILRGIGKLLGWILSYRLGCALVAALVAGLAVDYARHAHDDAVFAQRVAEFEQKQDARDQRIEKKTRDEVWTEIANETAANKQDEAEKKEFDDGLAPLPAGNVDYRIGDSFKQLCKLAGKTDCESRGDKGVSKAPGPSGAPSVRPRHRLPRVGWKHFGRAKTGKPAHRPAPAVR